MYDRITTAEAAKLLGVKPAAVRVYVHRGMLAVDDSNQTRWLFNPLEVAAFVRPAPGNPNFRRRVER